jgi:hypothetical protein
MSPLSVLSSLVPKTREEVLTAAPGAGEEGAVVMVDSLVL